MQVKEADPHCQASIVTLTVSHADTDMGIEVQCLNAFIKRAVSLQSCSVPLHVIRMEGPDMCIGALAAMTAYPNILLQAAQLRQARSCFFNTLSNLFLCLLSPITYKMYDHVYLHQQQSEIGLPVPSFLDERPSLACMCKDSRSI